MMTLLTFLNDAKLDWKKKGLICVKENTIITKEFLLDREDTAVTRSAEMYKQLFAKSGLNIIHEMPQKNFPKLLLPVTMYALR